MRTDLDIPACHTNLGNGEFAAADDPTLELLDEVGAIDVVTWGGR